MSEESSPAGITSKVEVPAVVRLHFDHYMKLLDLFETRQTSAYNFALLVYAGAGTAAGLFIRSDPAQVVEKPHELLSLMTQPAFVLIYSAAIPLILLPLFFLYMDVSMYCAALNTGNLLFLKEHGFEVSDPGILAHKWLGRTGLEQT